MGIIRVRDIKVHTNHGCLEEEGLIGSDYVVHVEVNCDLSKSAKTDALKDTVDYVAIYTIVYRQMKKRAKLLEVVVDRIIDNIFTDHLSVETVKVEVAKINPPIGGEVGYVSVERKAKRSAI
ncbi:MAG: dihydroneopterin aldolase [Flavobacteriaceae bacterium]